MYISMSTARPLSPLAHPLQLLPTTSLPRTPHTSQIDHGRADRRPPYSSPLPPAQLPGPPARVPSHADARGMQRARAVPRGRAHALHADPRACAHQHGHGAARAGAELPAALGAARRGPRAARRGRHAARGRVRRAARGRARRRRRRAREPPQRAPARGRRLDAAHVFPGVRVRPAPRARAADATPGCAASMRASASSRRCTRC